MSRSSERSADADSGERGDDSGDSAAAAAFTVVRATTLAPEEAWRRLTDWSRHGDRVPLTRVRAEAGEPVGLGSRVVARTGIGAVGFDDPMEVTVWVPPTDGNPSGHCELTKRGRVVLGRAELDVAPAPHGSLVRWREEARLAGVPRALARPVLLAARPVFALTLRHLLLDEPESDAADSS